MRDATEHEKMTGLTMGPNPNLPPEEPPRPTGGTFTLHMGGHMSSPIPYDADIDVLRAAVKEIVLRVRDEPPPPPTREDGLTAPGGWCAPSAAVYDFATLYDSSPITPAPPPTVRQRFRAVRRRVRAVRRAARAAWHSPDGYWEGD